MTDGGGLSSASLVDDVDSARICIDDEAAAFRFSNAIAAERVDDVDDLANRSRRSLGSTPRGWYGEEQRGESGGKRGGSHRKRSVEGARRWRLCVAIDTWRAPANSFS